MTVAPDFFHAGARELQDRFDSRALADRIVERLAHPQLTAEMREFIATRSMFFLATADARGRPDCSYKGGHPGFVRVLDDSSLVFPSYDGNGMFRSLGNIQVNPSVGLLFVDFESPRRLRVNGRASLDLDGAALQDFPGAEALVRVAIDAAFPNCPRYVHRLRTETVSEYAPRDGYEPPAPEWKSRPEYREVLPAGSGTRRDGDTSTRSREP
jgi:predicted pyridoxine 5'-phosphate oxidase superfamily flavin-nucleotide-binding protein